LFFRKVIIIRTREYGGGFWFCPAADYKRHIARAPAPLWNQRKHYWKALNQSRIVQKDKS